MKLNVQKRLAGQILKCSPKRVHFDEENLEDIKSAITKRDIRGLIAQNVITKRNKAGNSQSRIRKIKIQKSKGLRKGDGSKKGSENSRLNDKKVWIAKIRLQRAFLNELKEKNLIEQQTYIMLIKRAKGGYFRSKKHLKGFVQENKLFKGKL